MFGTHYYFKWTFFLLIFISIAGYAQTDTISKKEVRLEKKELKKKKKEAVIRDTIVLSNHDVLVGEIKKMDKSVLTLKTKYSDSDFKIKWHKVEQIKSARFFIIAMDDGQRLKSSINSISKKGKVALDTGINAVEENLIDVVYLEPIGKSFFSRMTIDVDFGVTLTKANNLKQLTSNLSSTYIENRWNADGAFKTVLSKQDSIADVSRMDGHVTVNYFLKNNWFVQLSAVYMANDELKLDLRSTYKSGAGYFFIHNSNMYFGGSGGLAYTLEKYIDDTPVKNSTELFFALGFNKYDIGDLSILTSAVIYPSLTENGRYRSDINFDMKYDLPLDLYIKMNITYNFDNRPVEGASEKDYVFTTSFGWEFN